MRKCDHENAARLERHERYTLIPPYVTLRRFDVTKDMVAADMGTGTGYFVRAAAELVGPAGHVYAVDMAQADCRTICRARTGGSEPFALV
jgi:predicted methyltransferase